MAISRSMPMFMTLAWIFSAAMIVKGIVYEKERRLKEVMKVMGLSNSVHWISWFITSFVMMFLSVLLLVAVLKGGKVLEHSDGLIVFVFLIVFTVATITQCFMFSVFFSRANLAAACAAILYFIGYLPYALVIQWEEYMLDWHKALACLSSTVAFGFGCSYFSKYEEQGSGAQWDNIMSSPIPEDNFSLVRCMMMMIVDSIFYLLVTWYVEAVFPGEYGVPKRWYFLFTKSYWCSQHSSDDGAIDSSNVELICNQSTSDNFEAEQTNLPLGVSVQGLRKVYKEGNKVAVNGLSLNFYEGQITSFLGHNGAGKTTTISILTGLFPPTQGTAFVYGKDVRYEMDKIRHNMGMCPQYNVLFENLTVEEHIYFYGLLKGMDDKDIKQEVNKMIADVELPHKRTALAKDLSGGMQRKLSIAMAFTAGSKVVILDEPTAGVDPYARRSIWDLLLRYKAGHTIILSTHFMDEADMLGDRIAIISHGRLMCCGSSMFLKKRFGSGYYLTLVVSDEQKSEDGAHGQMNESSSHHHQANGIRAHDKIISETAGIASSVEHKTTEFLRRFIPEAILVENFASELTYQLPDDVLSVRKFDALFAGLDSELQQLGVSGYGVSSTSLEEVFLNVAKLSGVDEDEDNKQAPLTLYADVLDNGYARPISRLGVQRAKLNCMAALFSKCKKRPVVLDDDDDDIIDVTDHAEPSTSSCADVPLLRMSEDLYEETDINLNDRIVADKIKQCNGAGHYQMHGVGLLRQQFMALFIKRFHYLRRSKKAFFSQIILPAVFICIAMIFSKINPPNPQMPAMEIHPWLLQPQYLSDNHLYMFYSKAQLQHHDREETTDWFVKMEQMLTSMPGLGTRCMNSSVHTIIGFPCDISVTNSSWTHVGSNANTTEPCSCESGFQYCPKGAAGSEPSKLQLPNTDFLYDLTSRNISDWLVKTTWDYKKKRYGGLTFGERQSFSQLLDDFSQQTSSTSKDSMKIFADKLSEALRENYAFNLGVSNVTLESLFGEMRTFAEHLVTRKIIKVWYDNTGYMSSVAYMNGVHNMLLRANSKADDKDLKNFGISLTNHPMNRTAQQMAKYTLEVFPINATLGTWATVIHRVDKGLTVTEEEKPSVAGASAVDALIAISVIFAMSQIPASFIVFLIEERESGAKHLQFVSGVSPLVFWLVNFVWDICNYLVSATLCIILFLIFQQHQYVSADNAPCLIALLFLYGWAVTPMMYPASYFFKVPSTAFVLIGCVNIFLGLLSTLSTFILELFMEERLDRINNILRQVFLVLPHFCLGRGLIDMTRNQLVSDVFASLGRHRFDSPFKWDLVGKNLFCLAFLGLFFFILTICIEYRFWYYKLPFLRKRWDKVPPLTESRDDEDIDVANERRRVATQQSTTNDILVLDRLTKLYTKRLSSKSHLAVDNITVGIHKGECFGLLGVNGAGKTTTFKMLTGDVNVTTGDARLAGFSVRSDLIEVHKRLGYCPQFDALCSLLTTTEHLSLYARLRGVPESDIPTVVQWAIQRLGLLNHAKKRASDLSGGNRRKLSTAIALVGNPPVVFLDEPTTGMDPKARRFLWNCIGDIVKDGRSVVLTSHSMEECEALCNRIAIMVNGTFKCVGSVQHLKNRFGSGYTVTIRVADNQPNISSLKEFIANTFDGIQLREEHRNVLHYHLAPSIASLAQVFHHLEQARNQYHIEDYSVSQTTLDQVFLNFAKLQTDLFRDEMEAIAHADDHVIQGRNSAIIGINGHSTDGVHGSSANC